MDNNEALETLREALFNLVNDCTSWNAAVEKIIGRQPNAFPSLLNARVALAATDGAKCDCKK